MDDSKIGYECAGRQACTPVHITTSALGAFHRFISLLFNLFNTTAYKDIVKHERVRL